jgi:hypothetical protein
MTGFRFVFPDDDDEGFELVEEFELVESIEDEQDSEELAQPEDDVIWETEED